ncbi:MAG: histidine phosphatase family protein [Rubellimicrobium sp.]|nr:histidine phosphatase family protein [Rubellimicrobium sp.]
MTLRLILTRHAKSDWSGGAQDDFHRPLNAHGRDEARLVGDWLLSRGYLPDTVLSSPARRTMETVEHLAARLGRDLQADPVSGLYGADAGTILDALHGAQGNTVLLVGHNPGIAHAAALLVHDRPPFPRFADYPTGATAVIDFALGGWADIAPGTGALRDFIVPDDLA